MVQRIVYPSFGYNNREELLQWHKRYTGLVTWIVLPLMLGQLLLGSIAVIIAFEPIALVKLLLIVMTWVLTFAVFVPLHNALETATDQQTIVQKLVRKNWSRTILWTLLFGLSLFKLFGSY